MTGLATASAVGNNPAVGSLENLEQRVAAVESELAVVRAEVAAARALAAGANRDAAARILRMVTDLGGRG